MVYGYARVSTRGQAAHGNSLEDQRIILRENGAEKIYEEHFTGTTMERPELDRLMEKIQSDDTLIVTKLDRLARNVEDGIRVIRSLLDKNIKVNVLNIGTLEDTALGKFFLATLLAVAELERSMIIERMQARPLPEQRMDSGREGPPFQKSRNAMQSICF